jgi:D-sedoheptulose 7-phosphate isomerase
MFSYENYFKDLSKLIIHAPKSDLKICTDLIKSCKSRERKLIFVGNGGSAAMASHLAVDFTKAAGVRAINFNEADLITCFANDYGYEHWVEKAIEAYADDGDVCFFISSSGKSLNIINGCKKANDKQLKTVTLSGFDANNPLRGAGHINMWVESHNYNFVEMTHHVWLLAMVDALAGECI